MEVVRFRGVLVAKVGLCKLAMDGVIGVADRSSEVWSLNTNGVVGEAGEIGERGGDVR